MISDLALEDETPDERARRLARERKRSFRARRRIALLQGVDFRYTHKLDSQPPQEHWSSHQREDQGGPDPSEKFDFEDPAFLEENLPPWPEESLETVTADILTEHRATLVRRGSGWVLTYVVGAVSGAFACSHTMVRSADLTPLPIESSVPILAEDKEGALYLAEVILAGHVAPELPEAPEGPALP